MICHRIQIFEELKTERTHKKNTKPEPQLTPNDNTPGTYPPERANRQEVLSIVRFCGVPNGRKETTIEDDTLQKHVLINKEKPGAKIYHKLRDIYQVPALEKRHCKGK